MENFKTNHWALLDLQYEYLDDGFKLTATTDVPCHLFCRMTTIPPRKHILPSSRRGTRFTGDIRFCFVVYEDNEQLEAGDTLTHTWLKDAWPICETRWFYFVGTQGGTPSVSETSIFKFHFPAPPPEPPPPMLKVFFAETNNRTIASYAVNWAPCRNGSNLNIPNQYGRDPFIIEEGAYLTVLWHIRRGFLTFKTDTLPDTARLVSANIWLMPWYIQEWAAAPYSYCCAQAGQQSDPVVISDWYAQTPHAEILGYVDHNDMVVGTYSPLPLNAEGLVHINKSGLTKYCIRNYMDILPPGIPGGRHYMIFYSQQKGPAWRPYLQVYYYPA